MTVCCSLGVFCKDMTQKRSSEKNSQIAIAAFFSGLPSLWRLYLWGCIALTEVAAMPQQTALCLSAPAPGQMGAAPHGGAVTGTMAQHLPVAESHKVKQSLLFFHNCSSVLQSGRAFAFVLREFLVGTSLGYIPATVRHLVITPRGAFLSFDKKAYGAGVPRKQRFSLGSCGLKVRYSIITYINPEALQAY